MTSLPPPPARKLPGMITREAPPGPEMTREQFELAMEDMTQDAARWRHLKRHWWTLADHVSNAESGLDVEHYVDEDIRRQSP